MKADILGLYAAAPYSNTWDNYMKDTMFCPHNMKAAS